jgi:plastocyanin
MIRLAFTALAMTFMIATGSGATAAEAGPIVAIDNFMFGPMTVTIPAGGTVTWVNHDDDPHTVSAVDKSFKSPALDTNQTYQRTFDRPGEYAYFCSLHPQMIGKIIVKPAG